MILVFVSFVSFVVQPLGAQSTPGSAEKGKQIYMKYGCYQCHGRVGQGGAGPRLGPPPPAFEAFARALRQPRAEMPPYTSRVVTDADLADIYAFLRALPHPARGVPMPEP